MFWIDKLSLAVLSANNELADSVAESISENVDIVSWSTIQQYLVYKTPLVIDFLLKLIIAVIVLLVGTRIRCV